MYSVQQYGGQGKVDETGLGCSTHDKNEKCLHNFSVKLWIIWIT
jgi:hypothetical protein